MELKRSNRGGLELLGRGVFASEVAERRFCVNMSERRRIRFWIKELMEKYGHVVRGVLDKRGLQPADADDLAQEVWLRVLEAAVSGRLNAVRDFEPWLATVTRNVQRDFWQKRKECGRVVVASEIIEPQNAFLDFEWQEALAAFMAAAPSEVKHPYRLMRRCGLTEKETAERLGVSVRTVRRRMRIAERLLCELLGLNVPEGRRAAGRPIRR